MPASLMATARLWPSGPIREPRSRTAPGLAEWNAWTTPRSSWAAPAVMPPELIARPQLGRSAPIAPMSRTSKRNDPASTGGAARPVTTARATRAALVKHRIAHHRPWEGISGPIALDWRPITRRILESHMSKKSLRDRDRLPQAKNSWRRPILNACMNRGTNGPGWARAFSGPEPARIVERTRVGAYPVRPLGRGRSRRAL